MEIGRHSAELKSGKNARRKRVKVKRAVMLRRMEYKMYKDKKIKMFIRQEEEWKVYSEGMKKNGNNMYLTLRRKTGNVSA